MSYSELEILIQKDPHGQFMISARHRLDAGDIPMAPVPFDFDPGNADVRSSEPDICGPALSNALFARGNDVREAFVAAKARSTPSMPLKVLLCFDPALSYLHALKWETMTDPHDRSPLGQREHTILSRFLFDTGQYMPRRQPLTNLKALVVISNPTDLSEDDLSKDKRINVESEAGTAANSMSGISRRTLRSKGEATLAGLAEELRQCPDILYLVCHGSMHDGQAKLVLESVTGASDIVAAQDVVNLISQEKPPGLVVLCSCQSAGTGLTGKNEVLSSIGPMLCKAGVPAVLAMQGKVSMDSMNLFMPQFFAELAVHGEVDRAASAARQKIRRQPDWWMPVVFTRISNSRIWYSPGFGAAEDGDKVDPWDRITSKMNARACTPIIGNSLAEAFLGSRRDMARQWGEKHRYPLSGKETDDLPQIAQYLSVIKEEVDFVYLSYYRFIYTHLLAHEGYRALVPDKFKNLDDGDLLDDLSELVSEVGKAARRADPGEPHAVLAGYRLPVYVTTDPSDLLVDAVEEKIGRRPRVRVLRWNKAAEQQDDAYAGTDKTAASAEPTRDNPIVVKLFGDLKRRGSLVLTEDQYFDYLAAAAASKDPIPPSVRFRLADSALLFVGFQAEAWEFRVLFRSLLNLEGADMLENHQHFSVQIDPNSILDPISARKYIEAYLKSKAKLRLYWGDVAMFIAELKKQTDSAKASKAAAP